MMEEGGRIFEKKNTYIYTIKILFRSCVDTPSLRFGGRGHAGGVERDGAEGSYIYILREEGKWGRERKREKEEENWLAGVGFGGL